MTSLLMHKVSMQLIRKIRCYNDWQLGLYPSESYFIYVFVWRLVIMCVGSVQNFCDFVRLGLTYVPF